MNAQYPGEEASVPVQSKARAPRAQKEPEVQDIPAMPASINRGAYQGAASQLPEFENASSTANTDVARRDIARKQLVHRYAKEQTYPVMIAPMYAPHFGRTMHVSVNGISISVPCDGTPYHIPETFAREVQRRLRAVNEQNERQARYGDIARNVESSPGALEMYG